MSKLIGYNPEQVPTNAMLGELAFKNSDEVVTNDDIGFNPNQIPLNLMLGSMAHQNSDAVTVGNLNVGSISPTGKASAFPYQVITGQVSLTASATYFDMFCCGHTHGLTIHVFVLNATSVANGGRHKILNFGTIYGGGTGQTVQHETAYNNGVNVSSISLQYVNSGSPNYKIQVAATYSGSPTSSMTAHYVVCGWSSQKMYGL